MTLEIPRKFNILVTGTPGTGKTALCSSLQDELGLTHIEIGKIVKDEHFYTEYDSTYDSYIIEEDDEDRLMDYLEPAMIRGGCCVDFHSCNFFPRRWFGAILVLRAKNDKVFDRLTARGYSEAKREENLEAEIMGTCEDEARESYDKRIVLSRPSDTLNEMLETIEMVRGAMQRWTQGFQEELAFAAAEEDNDEDEGDEDKDEEGEDNNNNNEQENDGGEKFQFSNDNNNNKNNDGGGNTNNNNNNGGSNQFFNNQKNLPNAASAAASGNNNNTSNNNNSSPFSMSKGNANDGSGFA